MRKFILLTLTGLIASSPAFAQFNINSGDGDVSIGPDGISIRGRGENAGKNVQITPAGIGVQETTRGKTQTVNIRRGGITVPPATTRTTTTRVTRPATSTKLSTQAKVTIIEQQIYGKTNASLPLIKRVEKLEQDNLGKVGRGVLNQRVDTLVRELGVNLGSSSTTTITSSPGGNVVTTTNSTTTGAIKTSSGRDVVLNGAELSKRLSLNGENLVVNGSECNVRVQGTVGKLAVNGSDNTIWLDACSRISVVGSSNKIRWKRGAGTSSPRIDDVGSDNSIAKGSE